MYLWFVELLLKSIVAPTELHFWIQGICFCQNCLEERAKCQVYQWWLTLSPCLLYARHVGGSLYILSFEHHYNCGICTALPFGRFKKKNEHRDSFQNYVYPFQTDLTTFLYWLHVCLIYSFWVLQNFAHVLSETIPESPFLPSVPAPQISWGFLN